MNVITLSSKGQVVIPSNIRNLLKLNAGDELVIEVEQNSLKLSPLKYKSLDNLFSTYKSTKFVSKKDIKDIKDKKFSKA